MTKQVISVSRRELERRINNYIWEVECINTSSLYEVRDMRTGKKYVVTIKD